MTQGRNTVFVVGVVAGICCLILLVFVSETIPPIRMLNPTPQKQYYNGTKPKVILFWTKFFGLNHWGFDPLGTVPFERLKDCPVVCEMTDQRSRLKEADVIAFHALELGDRPQFKLPNQRWLLNMMESPCYYGLKHLKNWKGVFNWTMTYRADSDFIANYSEVKPITTPRKRNYSAIMSLKSKKVAWFVSNCNTPGKREKYVKELQRYIPVDIYGACGPMKCPAHTPCEKHIYETYKFYLSFENSLANYYITEKFFKTLKHDIVSVVRSGANYSFYGIKPDWFIDARKFKTPKDLANFLIEIDKDDSRYVRYLRSKENVTSVDEYYEWCNVCKRINDVNDPKTCYDDILQWWRQNPCIPP
ncbi:alpha-(1,3)-fucosyltransferase C [Lingula anatina]|uniref:Fucosyltransferase n=1 Tax=Lingula anatina TaxID=7574 RepID=A0A1S3K3A5_LINAN|nr:alpha-(1,3)-fucosyltransferase C [Lingula anatina]|eukprot:XP_013417007.1 alpha-(1,3)-fucosyltransferase C [Lingula anatina]